MYKNFKISERKTVSNGSIKLSPNKFTKSLTSFHPKKLNSKNITQQSTIKKPGLNRNKNSKTKRIFFSNKKIKDLGYLLTNPISPKNNKKFKEIINKNSLRIKNIPSSDQRLYKYKNEYILNIFNNYKPNAVIDIKQAKNKYNLSNDKNDKKVKDIINKNDKNNISKNDSENNIRKTNGVYSNNININNINIIIN